MSLLSRGADTLYTFRFLKILVTKWTNMDAFKLGLIDENGKKIKKAQTPEEKTAYSMFHRLVFNIKRLLEKVPFGKTKLASFATALFLIKEETGMSAAGIEKLISKLDNVDTDIDLQESSWFINESGELLPGNYKLLKDVPFVATGEEYALKDSYIYVNENTASIDNIHGIPIFKVKHKLTNQFVVITTKDIIR